MAIDTQGEHCRVCGEIPSPMCLSVHCPLSAQDEQVTVTLPARAALSLMLIAQMWCNDEHLDPEVVSETYINQDDVWRGWDQLARATKQVKTRLSTYGEIDMKAGPRMDGKNIG